MKTLELLGDDRHSLVTSMPFNPELTIKLVSLIRALCPPCLPGKLSHKSLSLSISLSLVRSVLVNTISYHSAHIIMLRTPVCLSIPRYGQICWLVQSSSIPWPSLVPPSSCSGPQCVTPYQGIVQSSISSQSLATLKLVSISSLSCPPTPVS